MVTFNNQNKLELREIVLGHIKRILELSSHQLRDTSVLKNHGQYNEYIVNEDLRYSYVQSVENLSYVLFPFFDQEINKVYNSCIKIITSLRCDLPKIIPKTYKKYAEEYNGRNDFEKDFIIAMKVKYAKKLFIALNELLHRNDYLKSAVYGEGDNDDLVEEDGED